MDNFKTRDIYIASTLIALNYPLLHTHKEGKDYIFEFDAQEVPSGVNPIDNYWTDNLLVNPKRLFNEFKNLKHMIYDLRREEDNEG